MKFYQFMKHVAHLYDRNCSLLKEIMSHELADHAIIRYPISDIRFINASFEINENLLLSIIERFIHDSLLTRYVLQREM